MIYSIVYINPTNEWNPVKPVVVIEVNVVSDGEAELNAVHYAETLKEVQSLIESGIDPDIEIWTDHYMGVYSGITKIGRFLVTEGFLSTLKTRYIEPGVQIVPIYKIIKGFKP